nr:hypothetical protein [Arenivirga flava]
MTEITASASSIAPRVCALRPGAVSTTTAAYSCASWRSSRVASCAVIPSAPAGEAGAASTSSPLGCVVSACWTSSRSRAAAGPTAASIARSGAMPSASATSPNCRSRSTSTTRCGCTAASTVATFAAMVVLPTPPLGAVTTTTWPRSLSSRGAPMSDASRAARSPAVTMRASMSSSSAPTGNACETPAAISSAGRVASTDVTASVGTLRRSVCASARLCASVT